MKLPIYMDYHATTPVDPRVLDAMLPYFTEKFGNPASRQHQFGWIAEESAESERANIATLFGAGKGEIIFTSGATESNNLAIKGVAESFRQKGNHIITAATEHKSVLDSCKKLEKEGYRVSYLPVRENGLIDLDMLRDTITQKSILVSIMTANNEIGTIQNISEVGRICRERNVYFHTDATQAIGRIPVNVGSFNIDLMSFSGHKIYGPKGIGGLYVRNSRPAVRISAQVHGGGHEKGYRSGTLNLPGIVGISKALEYSVQSMSEESARLEKLRNKMLTAFAAELDEVYLNGHPERRLPNNLNMSFLYVEDSALLMSLKDIAISTGSACGTAEALPSHVLRALNLPEERLHSAVRFGLGRFTTEDEVDYVTGRVIESVNKLRTLSQSYRNHRKS